MAEYILSMLIALNSDWFNCDAVNWTSAEVNKPNGFDK